jgi:hypothetical protein
MIFLINLNDFLNYDLHGFFKNIRFPTLYVPNFYKLVRYFKPKKPADARLSQALKSLK